LRSAIYTDVEPFDLERIFDFPKDKTVPNLADQASLMPVLGAALRSEVAA